jgi:plasmid stabilization system protein ParE
MGGDSPQSWTVNFHFHPEVQSDLKEGLTYFDSQGGSKLGDRFFAEVQAAVERIRAHPNRYGFLKGDIRRAPLNVFKYHLFYRITSRGVRVLVLRHHRRNPRFGLSRQ